MVDTGDPLPHGFDAVIPIEQVEPRENGRVAIRAAVAPFEHVRTIGEDVVASEVVVPAMRRLGPADLASCAAAGVAAVDVVARPSVTVITTGDELVDVTAAAPQPGDILDSNAVLLNACVRAYGGDVVAERRVRDDEASLTAAVRDAIGASDVVIVNAGSSAGRDDYTARVFAGFGDVVVHGVAIRPGHPLVLAVARDTGVPLVGIPGYPVSAAICADLFLRPLLERLGRRDAPDTRDVEVELARKLFSPLGEDEFIRAVAARVDGRLVATPLRRGAGVITSLSRANVLIMVPRFSEGARAGTVLSARALRPLEQIERTLLAVGSHDVALDLLAGRLPPHTSAASRGWLRSASGRRIWQGRTYSTPPPGRTTTRPFGATGRANRSLSSGSQNANKACWSRPVTRCASLRSRISFAAERDTSTASPMPGHAFCSTRCLRAPGSHRRESRGTSVSSSRTSRSRS